VVAGWVLLAVVGGPSYATWETGLCTPAGLRRSPVRAAYHAEVDRDGKVWRIRVPEVARTTQARTLREVESMARDLIAIMDNIPADSFGLDVTPSPFPPRSRPSLTGPPNSGSKRGAASPRPRSWHDARPGVFATRGCRCRTWATHSECHSSGPSN
jgi:hypothetical protein